MRVRVLGCSGGAAPERQPSCYLLDRGVAVDAGALASVLSVEEQQRIGHVWLTHAHWDHVRDLPLSVINRGAQTPTLEVHGLPETVDAIRAHLMNDVVWFAAFDLPTVASPFVAARPISPGETQECQGYRVTAVPVPHTVPAVSYLFDDGTCSVLLNADTGGARDGAPGLFADLPRGASPLRALFLEASFPNRMRDFAVMTGHLTPEMLGREVAGLDPRVEVCVTHMKPGFEEEIAREVAALGRPNTRCLRDGDVVEC